LGLAYRLRKPGALVALKQADLSAWLFDYKKEYCSGFALTIAFDAVALLYMLPI